MQPLLVQIIRDEFDKDSVEVLKAKPDKVVIRLNGEILIFEGSDAAEFYGWAGRMVQIDEPFEDRDDDRKFNAIEGPWKDSENYERWGKDKQDDGSVLT
jgi:hypothetical protein